MNHSNNHTKILKRKTFLVQIGVLALAATPFVTIASDPTPTTPNINYDTEAINNVTNSDLKLPTSDAKVLPSEVKKPRPWVTSSGVECQFTIWTPDDDAGTLTWTISLTRGIGVTKTLNGTISGYLTTSLARERDQRLVDNVKVEDLNLPQGDPSKIVQLKLLFGKTSSGVKYYLKVRNINTEAGTIMLDVKLSKGKSASRVLPATISGYKPYNHRDTLSIYGVQTEDLNLPASDQSALASSVSTPNKGTTTRGRVNYEFTSWEPDNAVGIIMWQASLTKGLGTPRIIRGVIDGYQKTLNGSEFDTHLINSVIASDLKLPASDTKVLPSEINQPSSPPPTISGVAYQFITWTPNDAAGTITWVVSLTRGIGVTRTLTGTLSGFQTLVERNTKIINDLAESDLQLSESNSNLLASQIPAPPLPSSPGFGCQFIAWTPNDATGTIKWSISTKGSRTPKTLTGTFSGFKTSNYHYTKLINDVRVEDLNLPSSNRDALASSISAPNKGTTSTGINYQFTSWVPNDATGTIAWLANFTKEDGIPRKLAGTLSGFQTTSERDTNLINAVGGADLNLPASNANALPSTIAKPSDGTTTSGVSYTFSKWEHNDATGAITWEAELTKGSGTQKTLSGTISGFQTTSDRDTNLINEVLDADLNLPIVDPQELPSKIAKPSDGTTASGVSYTFSKWEHNVATGAITWEATITKGTASKNLSGVITGFQVVTNDHKDKLAATLSRGAIAGITLGVITGIGAISFLLYYFLKKFKK